jgi:hypothetical protein
LAIKILIPNAFMKMYCAIGIGKTWCIRIDLNRTVANISVRSLRRCL